MTNFLEETVGGLPTSRKPATFSGSRLASLRPLPSAPHGVGFGGSPLQDVLAGKTRGRLTHVRSREP